MAIAPPPARARDRDRATPEVDEAAAPGGTPAMLFLARPVRFVACLGLALLASRRWAALGRPELHAEMLRAALAAAAVGGLLGVVATREHRRPRLAVVAVLAVGFVASLVAVGVPWAFLRPGGWDDLVGQMGHGLATIPDLRVPYKGDDAWVRIALAWTGAVLLLAGTALALGGRGRPAAGAGVLVAVYTIAVVQVQGQSALGDGLLLALLCALLVLGDRVPLSQARGAGLALVAALGVAIVALPGLDARRPWLDYKGLTERLGERPASRFDWTQGYGPLPWQRHGREVLRIRSPRPAYWKAVTLDEFDGVRWRRAALPTPGTVPAVRSRRHPGWTYTVSVTVKDIHSRELFAPGEVLAVDRSSARVKADTPGTVVTSERDLKRGDTYQARVYAPTPSPRELERAGTSYPFDTRRALSISMPPGDPPPGAPRAQAGGPSVQVTFPTYGSRGGPVAYGPTGRYLGDGAAVLRDSPYARMWSLAQRLLRRSSSPYDYALRVQRRLRDGATYDERPTRARYPLDAFVFTTHRGYCQQFSGAMALLLRMGGVPARVAEGFAPGARNGDVYTVHDEDAHAWVELYAPGSGWVVVDPTPAIAPPAAQIESVAGEQQDRGGGAGDTAGGDRATGGGLRPIGGGAGGEGDGGGAPVTALVLLGLVAAGAAAGGVGHLRRRHGAASSADPALDELLCALARAGSPVPPGATLTRIATTTFARSPRARAYVLALAAARYAVPGGPATVPARRADRQALRRGLTGGDGPLQRLRGYRILPPRLPDVLAARAHRTARGDTRGRRR